LENVTQGGSQMVDSGVCMFTVYVDFNCPFSYALNERLYEMSLENQVDFRTIQHSPSANSNQTGFEVLSQLTAEVAEVRRRAPSTHINLPMFRPSSANASELLVAVQQIDSEQATQLRRDIFRALWVDGQDISSPEVLAGLLRELEIEQPAPSEEMLVQLSVWQSQWDSDQTFERNIPILISSRGETVIGFPLQSELDGFLITGSLISDQVLHKVRKNEPLQRILVLDTDIDCIRMVIEVMRDTQVEIVQDLVSLNESTLNLGIPDLILVNTAMIEENKVADWWYNSAYANFDTSVPVIFVSDDKSTLAEIAAFEAGAADYITKPLHPSVLQARLNMHLLARRSLQQLNNLARVDSLTSICNRRELDYRLMLEWDRAARGDKSLALLMIDIDNFKKYNDYFGHLPGDDCLIRVAQILNDCMQRSVDLIARYGGEEFAALLPESDLDGARKVAEICLASIADARIPHFSSTVSDHITVSIGVAAVLPVYGNNPRLLIEQADVSLYQAKKNGRNQICCFDEQL